MIVDLQLLSSMISFEEDLLLNRLEQLEGVVDFALHIRNNHWDIKWAWKIIDCLGRKQWWKIMLLQGKP